MALSENTPWLVGYYPAHPPNGNDPKATAQFKVDYDNLVDILGTRPKFFTTYTDYSQPPSAWAGNAGWSSWSMSLTGDAYVGPGSGTVPVVGMPIANSEAGFSNKVDLSYKAIAAGTYDHVYADTLHAWAKAGYKEVHVRPDYEYNGNWMPWGPGNSGAATRFTDFISAWRRVANVLKAQAKLDDIVVKTVWNPSLVAGMAWDVTLCYPGDDVCDIHGIDLYGPFYANPGTNRQSFWENPPGGWGWNKAVAFAKLHGKPLSLPETGSGLESSPGTVSIADDAEFVEWLAAACRNANAQGVPVMNVALWDQNTYTAKLQITGGKQPLAAAAWGKNFGKGAVTTSVPPVVAPPASPVTTKDTALGAIWNTPWFEYNGHGSPGGQWYVDGSNPLHTYRNDMHGGNGSPTSISWIGASTTIPVLSPGHGVHWEVDAQHSTDLTSFNAGVAVNNGGSPTQFFVNCYNGGINNGGSASEDPYVYPSSHTFSNFTDCTATNAQQSGIGHAATWAASVTGRVRWGYTTDAPPLDSSGNVITAGRNAQAWVVGGGNTSGYAANALPPYTNANPPVPIAPFWDLQQSPATYGCTVYNDGGTYKVVFSLSIPSWGVYHRGPYLLGMNAGNVLPAYRPVVNGWPYANNPDVIGNFGSTSTTAKCVPTIPSVSLLWLDGQTINGVIPPSATLTFSAVSGGYQVVNTGPALPAGPSRVLSNGALIGGPIPAGTTMFALSPPAATLNFSAIAGGYEVFNSGPALPSATRSLSNGATLTGPIPAGITSLTVAAPPPGSDITITGGPVSFSLNTVALIAGVYDTAQGTITVVGNIPAGTQTITLESAPVQSFTITPIPAQAIGVPFFVTVNSVVAMNPATLQYDNSDGAHYVLLNNGPFGSAGVTFSNGNKTLVLKLQNGVASMTKPFSVKDTDGVTAATTYVVS